MRTATGRSAAARAAQTAADDMQQVKSDLAHLEADAAGAGFEVDRASSTVMPGPAMQGNMIDLIAAEAKGRSCRRGRMPFWRRRRGLTKSWHGRSTWPPARSRSPIPRMTTVPRSKMLVSAPAPEPQSVS